MSHLRSYKDSNNAVMNRYKSLFRRKCLIVLILAAALFSLSILSLCIGSYDISSAGVVDSLIYNTAGPEGVVVRNLRLPRMLSAIAAGGGLGLAGMLIQTLLGNPLASPSTLGISQGAAFGAAFALVFLGPDSMIECLRCEKPMVSVFAFAGSMGATVLILLLARLRIMTSGTIVLAGIALSSLFMSGTVLIQYFATEMQLATVVFWTFGDVSRATMQETLPILLFLIIIMTVYLLFGWKLRTLSAGDESAIALGVNVSRMRIIGMICAAVLASLVTAFNGVIAFLGLLAPHIARKFASGDPVFTTILSVLTGALLLLGADSFARTFFSDLSLPVGILTSFMGAPLFLYLLLKDGRL